MELQHARPFQYKTEVSCTVKILIEAWFLLSGIHGKVAIIRPDTVYQARLTGERKHRKQCARAWRDKMKNQLTARLSRYKSNPMPSPRFIYTESQTEASASFARLFPTLVRTVRVIEVMYFYFLSIMWRVQRDGASVFGEDVTRIRTRHFGHRDQWSWTLKSTSRKWR